jgi:hypothetical protein
MKLSSLLRGRFAGSTLCLLLATMALLLAGCSSSPSVVGKWKVDVSQEPADNSPGGALAKSLAEGLAKSMTLELKEDKTFAMTMIFPMSGTYSVDGHNLKLHMTSVMGMDPSKMQGANQSSNQDMMATISDDGSKLTITSAGGTAGKQPMAFIRDK